MARIATSQGGINGLHRQVPELRPQRLQIFQGYEGEVSKVDYFDGQGARVDLRIDLYAVPQPVCVQRREEGVL